MTDENSQLRRHFLGWERPLLPQAVEFLAGGWEGRSPLDLSGVLVVVPTRQSGRRLREALAVHAAGRHQAVFAPRVVTPDRLIEPPAGAPLATTLETWLAWTDVLLDVDLAGCRAVFPVDPPERSFGWALGLARTLAKLQQELAEGGLRLADVAGRAGEFPETDRWRQLAALEQIYDARLARDGLVDPQAARIRAATEGKATEGWSRVVVLGVPDPLPLATRMLAGLARQLPVDLVVHAPSEEASQFDEWGRPRPEAWGTRVLSLADFKSRVHLGADPAAQAAWLVAQAQAYEASPEQLAIGVADPEVLAAAESALRAAGVAVFNPEGRPRRSEGFYELLESLSALARSPDFAAVAALARCPDVMAWLEAKLPAGFSAAGWLAGLDELHARHLPPDLRSAIRHAPDLRRHPELAPALDLIDRLRSRLSDGPFAESVVAILAEVFAARTGETPSSWTDAVEAWMEIVRGCATAERRRGRALRVDWWQLALGLYGDSRQAREKPPGALELQGWLELAWEDAPHLVVAGFNEGRVPDAVAGDAFLPESLRGRLGLKTNEARLARDAFLLQALAAARDGEGRLDLLFGKFSSEGEPLRPSRLLLRCPDPELPARVDFLFRAPERPGPGLAWRRAWKLQLPRRASPARVSVTALKRWLRCPLRFYLQQVLQMEPVDPAKAELDAFDFGTLCHGALEAAARHAAMRGCTDPAQLRDFLTAEFDRQMHARYGRELTLPLLVQQESARQRLGRAAEVLARERAEGWAVVEVERKFELPVDGLVLVGKIDRIERHERSGEWRVLDFKTSDTPVGPAEAHLRGLRRGETPPEWARWSGGPSGKVWSDLQLPVYRRVLAAEAAEAPVACAYFNLPRAAGDTGLRPWVDFTPELEASAWTCVQGVVAAIRAGVFWPPRELSGREAELDDFAALFHGRAEDSVIWEGTAP